LRIAILAWGSLVWDGQSLAITADFKPRGPSLPLEFCRVSLDGRLTLVIEDSFGTPCITYSAISAFDDLDAAIENLRLRERMPSGKGVGFVAPYVGRQSATAMERHPRAVQSIVAWINKCGFDAAIWTALASNFEEKTSEPFSAKTAIRYLEGCKEKTLDAALRYIRQAPSEIRTPVREAVSTRWPTLATGTDLSRGIPSKNG
jgi:hypothetical protein